MAENIEIEHGGKSYTANLNGVAEVQYIEPRSAPHNGEVDYLWELTGAHTGDPIRVWMLGIGEEFDEDGRTVGWDRLVWADDESKFDAVDGYLLDSYTDPLRDELLIIAKETWD
jgi:hypothetical protein